MNIFNIDESKFLVGEILFDSTLMLYLKSAWTKVKISEETIKTIHTNYMHYLLDMYQCQPRTPDEFFRFSFVTSMITSYPLFVDGDMLWKVVPFYPCEFGDIESEQYNNFQTNVVNRITLIYESLTNLNTCRPLNIPRVLMKLRNYLLEENYTECLEWIGKLRSQPDLSERMIESMSENYLESD